MEYWNTNTDTVVRIVADVPRRGRYRPTPIRYGVQAVHGEYITVREAAEMSGVTRSAIRARIRRGQLPAIKIADMWLISRNISRAITQKT